MMSPHQKPLGTKFGPAATADDVLAGIDLTGKNAIVTGGNAGIGLEVARALAKAGASVTVASRSSDSDGPLKPDGIETGRIDLADPSSIDTFAARWLATGRPLHILVNNAGIPAPRTLETDARGIELQFSANYLGHFQLTQRLLPALKAAQQSRVVNLSSGAQRFGTIRWDDISFGQGYNSSQAYAQSKTAMVLFAVELDRRHARDGIRAYSVHPGVVVGTALNGAAGEDALRSMGLIDENGRAIIDPEFGTKTPEQGASTIAFAATSPLLADVGGVYLKDNDISVVDDQPRSLTAETIPSEVVSQSIDPQLAQRLWELSERLIG